MTRQSLADQDVVRDELGEPVVARVAPAGSPRTFRVYLPIQDEDYFFVATIGPGDSGELEIKGTSIWARTRVYLLITSETMSVDEITARVGLSPTDSIPMGQPRLGALGVAPLRWHSWKLEPDQDVPGEVEEKLEHLLTMVAPAAERIVALGPACYVQVSVVYKAWIGNGCIGGFGFDPAVVRRIAALGATVDCDVYVGGPWLH